MNSIRYQPIYCVVTLCCIVVSNAFGQSSTKGATTQAANGFTFSYPKDWKLTDTTSGNLQQFRISPPTGNGVIILSSPNVKVSNYSEFQQVRDQTSEQFFEKIHARFSLSGKAGVQDHCERVRSLLIPGQRITGLYDKVPSTADFAYFAIRKRFFAIVALRENSMNETIDEAIDALNRSLSIDGSNEKEADFMIDSRQEGVVNGRAIILPKPVFSLTSRPAIYEMRIRIRVLIDEEGNVIWANGILGNVLSESSSRLVGPALVAAKNAKFSPTLFCGKPARVHGIIEYIFGR